MSTLCHKQTLEKHPGLASSELKPGGQRTPRPIEGVRNYLDQVPKQWDKALRRLKLHLED
jgi:hypothetical protein